MRSSNFYRSPRLPHRFLFAALAALCFSPRLPAVDPNRTVSQYIRDRWGPEKGFPSGPVYAITQTTDGYLWIGTEAGLVRFDGLTFQLTQSARTTQFSLEQPLGQSLGVTADDSGSLWIRLRGLKLLGYRSGNFFEPRSDLEQTRAGVTAATVRPNGALIFATRRNGLLSLRQGQLEKLAAPESMPESPVISLAVAADGDVWLGTRDVGLVRLRSGQTTSFTKGLPDLKINCLLPVAAGLWIATDNGIVRWNGSEITTDGIPPALQHSKTLAMIQDHDANIWIGTAQGLFRVNPKGISRLAAAPNEAITALFEDREGNLWIGCANGIERLRDSVFATYSIPEGLPSENNGPVYADAQNRTWFAPENGGLYSLTDGKIASIAAAGLDKDTVYSIAGNNGGLWIGRQRGGLTHLIPDGASFTAKTYNMSDGLAQNTVFAVSISRDGTVWAGTLNGGVSRLQNGSFTTFTSTGFTSTNGLASNTISSVFESSDGTMWFATPSGLSSARATGPSLVWRTYTVADGLPSDNVNCVFEDSTGTFWIGTLGGLAFLRSGRIQLPAPVEAPFQEQIFGIVEDRTGSLWITTADHVLRVNRDRLLGGTARSEEVREYELADGLRSLSGVKRHRSLVADPLGRIWLSTSRGLSVVDPARLTGRAVPALVHIQALSADGNPINLGGHVRIPPGKQRIILDYSGLSLAIPERTRFRYTLEPFDHGWSQPVASRQAVYTNLGPGKYRFRVVASNLDEVFDSQEATLAFQIEPMFWQTWWFILGTLTFLASAIVAAVRIRIHRVARQMNLIFEERLAERTLIAQELHDTLLQGFLSASMQLHVAADGLAEDSPAKPSLGRILALMSRVIGEGRNALQGLRSSSGDAFDLERAFSNLRQELELPQDVSFRVLVDGKLRPLHPVLRDEVYRIGREALVNAFRHSGATAIEVELEYAVTRLRVLVRDNGCGIDPLVLQSGREGHWGLPGMRERAESIGATLRVWSRASYGTEIELCVPSHVAFQKK